MSNITQIQFSLGRDTVTIETGKLAFQAGGAVTISVNETTIMVTATGSESPREGIDFFPLLVDYEEKMFAVGRIPGSFMRRESRPSQTATLTSRLIDRPIRPLFPEGYRNDVQVVASLWSCDQVVQPDILAMIGASAALSISDVPFEGPIGAVRIGRIDGEFIINPTFAESEEGDLDLVIAGTEDAVLMVEAGIKILSEEIVLDAIALGHEEIKKIVAEIKKLQASVGKPKRLGTLNLAAPEFRQFVASKATEGVRAAMKIADKAERKVALKATMTAIKEEVLGFADSQDEAQKLYFSNLNRLGAVFHDIESVVMRSMILDDNCRLDGRDTKTIRPISSEVGLVPRVHGTGLFTRGTTQALSAATLGSAGDAQRLDEVSPDASRRYMHHYNFPGFSVGEVKPMRSPGRREIGHGALAERALIPVLPSEDEFPYTIRVVSDILSSNGSTSMASTCGSTLSLMDAGVPLKAMVAGVAMGLIKEGDRYAILTDILGDEDHLGDMDFKVTGTDDGITALQMDIKIKGISIAIMKEALEQARQGRLHILSKMREVISEPRTELSPYAPRIIIINIDPESIGELIGPGGKNVKKIVDETGVKIDIEDDGRVFIVTHDAEAAKAARRMVERVSAKPEVGKVYPGKVTRIMNFGAFLEIMPGKEGMLHISQIQNRRIARVEDVLSVGDQIDVQVAEIDGQNRVNLTRKGLPGYEVPGGGDDAPMPSEEHHQPRRPREFQHSSPRGEYRGGGDRGGDRYGQDAGQQRDYAPRRDRTERADRGDRPLREGIHRGDEVPPRA